MMRNIGLAACLAIGLAGCAITGNRLDSIEAIPPEAAAAPEITWQIQNRFRLIDGGDDEKQFHRKLSAYIVEYEEWYRKEPDAGYFPNVLNSDLVHSSRLPRSEPSGNFKTHYDTRTTSYRCRWGDTCEPSGGSGWIRDPDRTVLLSVAAFGDQECVWTVGGAPHDGKCNSWPTSAQIETPLTVSVRLKGAATSTALTAEIVARDLKIVALGDSFSAGEGNPHSQWRFFTLRPRPALWLDPRCHRSLMSGPSLAAAYLAQNNPHVSVTLLHYGCSGATIADGVATPWAYLETSEQVRRRYSAPAYRLLGVKMPADQATEPLGRQVEGELRDYPPSQIEQALRDLDGPDGLVRPDVVLISVGGNDVGFADIVTGLSTPGIAVDLALDGKLPAPGYPDTRKAMSFDQYWWAASARGTPCKSNAGPNVQPDSEPKDRLDCMIARVTSRIDHEHKAAGSLAAQYRQLATALTPLAPKGEQNVFITDYPNFVSRADNDEKQAKAGATAKLMGCNDAAFDGRPGLVPAVQTFLDKKYGMKEESSEAVERFLVPLNGEIKTIADEKGWTEVSSHVGYGAPYGYCSFRRFYNTWADSMWNQGRVYPGRRPLGNFVIASNDSGLSVEGGRAIKKGDPLVWDVSMDCFRIHAKLRGADEQGCVGSISAPPSAPVRYDHDRLLIELGKAKDGDILTRGAATKKRELVIAERENNGGNLISTTGPVHPNLFGHCNYAAAIVSKVAAINKADPRFDAAFAERVEKAPLIAEDVCKPEAWGYRLKKAPPSQP